MFGKSVRTLEAEVAALRAQANARWSELEQGADRTNKILQETKPLYLQIAKLERRIHDKTPLKKLYAHRDELQKKLNALVDKPSLERANLSSELRSVDDYLKTSIRNPKNELGLYSNSKTELTLKSVLTLATLVVALLCLRWLAEWVAVQMSGG